MHRKFAVFIDGDNICPNDYETIIKEIGNFGTILIKQVYGDWTTPQMNKWKEKLIKEPAITTQEFRSGKNATDTRIIMDVIELMLTNSIINSYCIVSTDADFFGLALRLRSNGKFVLGIGREHAKPIWQESCNKFIKIGSLNMQKNSGGINGN